MTDIFRMCQFPGGEKRFVAVLLSFLFIVTPALLIAQTDPYLDDELLEITDYQVPGDEIRTNDVTQDTDPGRFGSVRLTLKYLASSQTEYPQKIVSNRASMRLEWNTFFADHFYLLLDGKMETFAANDHRTQAEEDRDYLLEASIREGYLQVSVGSISAKIGRQVIVWGEADSTAVTDLVSPRDQSEFVFTTLEDLRLGQALLQITTYQPASTLELIFNPEPRLDLLPEKGTEYYIAFYDPQFFEITEELPNEEDAEFGLRWKKPLEKGDLSLMIADLVENQPKYRFDGYTSQTKIRLIKGFSRFQMIGVTGNFSNGSFLWQGEVSYKQNRTFQSDNLIEQQGLLLKNTFDSALAVEYSPTGSYTIKLEVANQHIYHWERSIISAYEDETSSFLMVSLNLLHDTLKLQYTCSNQVQNQYMVQQLEAVYDFSDTIQGAVNITQLDFPDQESALYPLREKDRATAYLTIQF